MQGIDIDAVGVELLLHKLRVLQCIWRGTSTCCTLDANYIQIESAKSGVSLKSVVDQVNLACKVFTTALPALAAFGRKL